MQRLRSVPHRLWRRGKDHESSAGKDRNGIVVLTPQTVPAHLSALAGNLNETARRMEPDFVRLAQGLTALHRGATDLGKLAAVLVDSVRTTLRECRLAGDDGLVTSALRELQGNLGDSQQRLQTLAAMSSTLGKLRVQGFGIARTATMLKASGCNFAVESARTTECQDAFGDFVQNLRQLADQVGSLGENISDQAQRTQTEQEILIRSITKGLGELQQLTDRSTSAVAAASEHIQGMLDSSAMVVDQAGQRAREVGRHSEDASYFLQYGDIVRQKLEHVAEALAAITTDSPANAKSLAADKLVALDRLIAIQAGQLEAIRTETLTARGQLTSAFAGLASETTALVGNIAALAEENGAGTKEGEKSDRLKNLSADILHLQTLHARGHELGLQSQGTAQRAAEASTALARHLDEVNSVNLKLHLQALNAIVKTAWLGTAGATLGVLSAHVHEVSQDSGRSVAEILPLLDHIRSCTLSLGHGVQEPVASTITGDSALERGLRDVARLHEQFHHTSVEAGTLAERQKQSLAEISSNLDFLSEFDTGVTALITELRVARACLAPHLSSVNAKPVDEAELLATYTMESERDVHRRVVAQPLPVAGSHPTLLAANHSAGTEPNRSPATAAAGADDNVELF